MKRPPQQSLVWASLVILGGLSCDRVETTRVKLSFEGQVNQAPVGFDCTEMTSVGPKPVFQRIFRAPPERRTIAVLVDLVRLGGQPGCSPDFFTWCQTHDCRAISEVRGCRDVYVGTSTPGTIARDIRDGLAEPDAPVLRSEIEEPVVVRVVAGLGTCKNLEATRPSPTATGFSEADLIGCAASCPVQFGPDVSEVRLSIGPQEPACYAGMVACASGAQ